MYYSVEGLNGGVAARFEPQARAHLPLTLRLTRSKFHNKTQEVTRQNVAKSRCFTFVSKVKHEVS